MYTHTHTGTIHTRFARRKKVAVPIGSKKTTTMSVCPSKTNHIIRNLETHKSLIIIVFMKCMIVFIAVAVVAFFRGTAASHARGGKDAKHVPPKLRSLRRANVMSGSTALPSGRQRYRVNVQYVPSCNGGGGGGTLTASIKNPMGRPVRSVTVRLVITETKKRLPMRQRTRRMNVSREARSDRRGVATFRLSPDDEGDDNRSSRCVLQIRDANLPRVVQRVPCSEALRSKKERSAECPPTTVGGSSTNNEPATAHAILGFGPTPSDAPPTMAPAQSAPSAAAQAWDDADDNNINDGATESSMNDDAIQPQDDSTKTLAPSPAPTPRGATPSAGAAAATTADDDDTARYDDGQGQPNLQDDADPTSAASDDDAATYDDDATQSNDDSYGDDDNSAAPSLAPSSSQ
jgi:hypothetical protein